MVVASAAMAVAGAIVVAVGAAAVAAASAAASEVAAPAAGVAAVVDSEVAAQVDGDETPISIRDAEPEDATVIHELVVELATFEREPDAVMSSPDSIRAQLEEPDPPFECLIAEQYETVVGFALFYQSFSTWAGVPGIYLDDLFVRESARNRGVGRALLAEVARIAFNRGCRRLEWQVLDWNTPAIDFYESLGAEIMREWLPVRVSGSALAELAATAGDEEE